ncbi:Bacterial type II secretion system protein F protein, partial [human gut metagenome]
PEFLNSKILEIRNSIMKGKTLSESLEESMLLSSIKHKSYLQNSFL